MAKKNRILVRSNHACKKIQRRRLAQPCKANVDSPEGSNKEVVEESNSCSLGRRWDGRVDINHVAEEGEQPFFVCYGTSHFVFMPTYDVFFFCFLDTIGFVMGVNKDIF
jgi:hypothetical protein